MQPLSNRLDTMAGRWHFATMPKAKKPTIGPDVPITVRFPSKLRDDLKTAAETDGRSFNAYVVRTLQAHVDAAKRK